MVPVKNREELYSKFEKLFEENLTFFYSKVEKKLFDLADQHPKGSVQWFLCTYIGGRLKYFVMLPPEELEKQIVLFEEYSQLFCCLNSKKQLTSTPFGKQLLTALNYNGFRNKFGTSVEEITGLKTCPYCNSALTVVIRKSNRIKKARFQLDHFFPKVKYPFLSISFFNLIPACSNCNLGKGSTSVKLNTDFHPYFSETPQNPFQFRLEESSILDYIDSKNKDDLQITFSNNKSNTSGITASHHNESYAILPLYNTQKDIAEEMIWKLEMYSNSRLNELETLLSGLNYSKEEIKRMIVGNYTEVVDIHKRPMSKFMQDIAKDLNLI